MNENDELKDAVCLGRKSTIQTRFDATKNAHARISIMSLEKTPSFIDHRSLAHKKGPFL